ncbi:MAG: hypothetical protein WBW70_09930 [Candidatus Sulfotelmatobacter sp.]
MQRGFHLLLMGAGRAPADPVPALRQKFLPRVQALGMQPDSAGLDGGELDERILQ